MAEGHDDKHHPPIQWVHCWGGAGIPMFLYREDVPLTRWWKECVQFGEESIGIEYGIISNGASEEHGIEHLTWFFAYLSVSLLVLCNQWSRSRLS